MSKTLAFQIRAMRERQEMSQNDLAEKVGMNQNAISRLENPNYGKATITTLKRIAGAFDVALVVRFVPFSQFADWVSGTAFQDRGLLPESLAVPCFQEETRMDIGQIPNNINVAVQISSCDLVSNSEILGVKSRHTGISVMGQPNAA